MAYGSGYVSGYGPDTLPTFPTVYVEIAFDSDPLAETAVWTDVSEWLRSFDVNRGRQRELDRYQTGRMTVTLDNRDRRFDSEYGAGPYAGKILPAKRIRLRAALGSTTYPVFDGFIDSWEDRYVYPNEAQAVVSVSDGFKTLAQADLASSAYAQLVAEDAPVAWWRLDESDGTTAHDAAGDIDLETTDETVAMGSETLLSHDSGAAAMFDPADTGFYRSGALPLTGGPLTIEAIFRSTPGAQAGVVAANVTHVQGTGAVLYADAAFGLVVAKTPGAAVIAPISGATLLEDGLVHHVAGVWNGDGTLKIYIDGVDRTVGTPTLATGAFNATTGITQINGHPDTDAGIVGTVDEVAFYDYALAPARIQLHADAVTDPWNGDTPGTRIGRILDAVDWPAALRDLDVGTSVLQPATIEGPALDHVQKVRDSEFGEVYITAAGEVRFEGRDSLANQPVQATFGDDLDVGELEYADIVYDYSDRLIRNDVTITRVGGLAQNARNEPSITAYQRQSYVRDGLIHNSDTLSRHAAEFLVAEYGEPLKRVAALTIMPQRNPANLFPQVLGRELTDRVTVVRRPQGIGDPISQVTVIEGIAHRGTPKHWETTWALSPAYVAEYFVWDESEWDTQRWFF